MKKYFGFVGITIFFLLIAGDILANLNPLIGKISTILWYISYLYIFYFCLLCFKRVVLFSIKNKAPLSLLLIGLWLFIILQNSGNPKNLSGETTQELSCALNHFKVSGDWGYKKVCFFGYPVRQHFLHALPTLIFGRNLFNLNFGGTIYFIFGIIIFSSGMLKYLKYSKSADMLNGFILASIFHIHYVNHFLFFGEQSIFPFSFGLLITGLFLDYLADKNNFPIYLFGYLLLYLIYSYTPGLSLYLFSLLVIIYLLFDKNITRNNKILFLIILIMTLISFRSSLRYRGDINIWQPNVRSEVLLKEDLLKSAELIFLNKNGTPIVSSTFNIFFLTIIISSILFLWGWKAFIAAFWIVATIIIAEISQGYSYYVADFRLHRATVIFPVCFLMLIFWLEKIREKININSFVGFLIVYIFLGLIYQKSYLDTRQVSEHYLLITWLSKNVKLDENKNEKLNLYFIGDINNKYMSINDSLQYFIPQLTNSYNSINNCDLSSLKKGIHIVRTNNFCYQFFTKNNFKFYGIFQNKEDELGVFETGIISE